MPSESGSPRLLVRLAAYKVVFADYRLVLWYFLFMLTRLGRQFWLFSLLIFLSPGATGQQTSAPNIASQALGNFKAEMPRPNFADYTVKRIYRGEPASPIISKEFHEYRTMIRRGARSNVEFAGHYTLPRWGCGTSCFASVIVDSISGKIYDVPFAVDGLPFNWTEKHESDVDRMEFHANSRLLKINACPNEEDCGLYDFEMVEGKGLKLVRRELLPAEFQQPPPLLQYFLQKYATRLDAGKTTQYFAVTVSLHDDASLQEIVYLQNDGWCGSGGCTLLILNQQGYSYDYTVVSKIMGARPPVHVLSTETKGWHDLSVGVQGGGIVHAYEAKLRFNGRSYPISPTMPSAQALNAEIPGEVVVPTSVPVNPLYP